MLEKKVNFLYFAFLFICLTAVHSFHLLLLDAPVSQQGMFLVDIGLQCFLESLLLLVLAELIFRYLHKTIFFVYIAATFLLLISQVIDFFLVRILDLTVWFGFGLVQEESWENFMEILEASSVSLSVWLLFGAMLVLLPLAGVLLFFFFDRLGKKRAMTLKHQLLFFGTALMGLIFWDFYNIAPQDSIHYEKLRRALPFKSALFSPDLSKLKLGVLSAPCQKEIETTLALKHAPDIYIFVIESLREDFITSEIAPNLFQFKKENVACDLSLSAANATHLSWFSLFSSQYPFNWSRSANFSKKEGSPPLKLLKERGYSIHVYSSAGLGFYELGERLFGKGRKLADSFFVNAQESQIAICEKDEKILQALSQKMKDERGEGKHLHIVFLNSTHFDYSWPKKTDTHFLPFQEEIDYFKAAYSKEEVEGIKNRYRNAIHYLDFLFGKFMSTLKETNASDEAIVVVTGDHGEEFYEDGHLFHGSTLNRQQTQVPLYFKFGNNSQLPSSERSILTSHIDIFPTLFHYLFQQELVTPVLQGESIFQEKGRWPYAVVARYNGGSDPTEILIHNGRRKIICRMAPSNEIFPKTQLSILSVKDLYDQNVPLDFSLVREEFGAALERLFPEE